MVEQVCPEHLLFSMWKWGLDDEIQKINLKKAKKEYKEEFKIILHYKDGNKELHQFPLIHMRNLILEKFDNVTCQEDFCIVTLTKQEYLESYKWFKNNFITIYKINGNSEEEIQLHS